MFDVLNSIAPYNKGSEAFVLDFECNVDIPKSVLFPLQFKNLHDIKSQYDSKTNNIRLSVDRFNMKYPNGVIIPKFGVNTIRIYDQNPTLFLGIVHLGNLIGSDFIAINVNTHNVAIQANKYACRLDYDYGKKFSDFSVAYLKWMRESHEKGMV